MEALAIASLGFLLGIRHAVDPDHVVAVGTFATRTTSLRRSAMVGALWGVGHTSTLLLVGGTLIVMRSRLSDQAALVMELGVAAMLITLGIINLVSGRRTGPPSQPNVARPVCVGMVHGMAGSAAIALMVLATISSMAVGVLYLLIFGLGTIVGMVGVTAAVVLPATHVIARAGMSQRAITLAAGALSLGFGLFMVIGV